MPAMIPFAPLFAKGKTSEQAVAGFAVDPDGKPYMGLSATAVGIAVGDRIFVSNADGSYPEYLGKATQVFSNFIFTQLETQFARTNGLVWTPTSYWQSALPGVGARERSLTSGIEVVESTGTAPLLTRTAEAREVARFTFSRVPASEWEAFCFWMRITMNGRLGSWTAAWYDVDQGLTKCAKVKDARADRALEATHEAFKLRSWVCELAVVSDLTYVS